MVVFGGKSSSAKTKLFEQPLDKLFSPKAIKQLSEAISASNTRLPLSSSLSAPLTSTSLTWAKLSQANSVSKRRRTLARLRRFTIDANNNADLISSISIVPVAMLNQDHQDQYSSLSSPTITPVTANISMQQTRTTTTQPQSVAQNTLPNHHLKHDEVDSRTQQSKNSEQSSKQIDEAERARLLLNVLPDPIKRLLNELYLRGPETVGIFRKSPNAKHCKELRQKLEAADGQHNSIEQFQVTVIASVFKEWLRSLPDCLLMSRLYPQWIDVARLIEPLHLEQQSNRNIDSQNVHDPKNATSSSLASSPGLDSAKASSSTDGYHQESKPDRGELSREPSCSLVTTTPESTGLSPGFSHDGTSQTPVARYSRRRDFKSAAGHHRMRSEDLDYHQAIQYSEESRPPMTELEFRDRHIECIRIVRQLLELLNEPNLILLRAIICVLWHIANNSEHNKMSSQNLGVCIGQSLLNDEHQSKKSHASSSNLYSMRSSGNLSPTSPSSGAASALKQFSSSTFVKRHRRGRSQCFLASTLSLTNLSHLSSSPSSTISDGTPSSPHNNSMNNCSSLLDSSGPQEAAKYVPILVAFMIDNAKLLFGYDIMNLFGKQKTSGESQAGSPETLQQQDSRKGSSDRSQPTIESVGVTETLELAQASQKKSDGIGVYSTNNQSVTSVVSTARKINDLAHQDQKRTRPPTATQRLCINSSDLVTRSSANLINYSTKETDAEPSTGNQRSNPSMSVIVQISNIVRDISQPATTVAPTNKLSESEMLASSRRSCEPGTTTSILIENTPNTMERPTAGPKDRQRPIQSSESSSSNINTSEDDDEVDSCRRKLFESQSVSSICGSQNRCPIESNFQQRPLSASESTGSSSRASSSTSGVHSDSPAFSSETDTHQHGKGQATTCSSASISSPDPSSTTPSICTSPVDLVVGSEMGSDYCLDSAKALRRQNCNVRVSETQLTDNGSQKSTGNQSRYTKEPPVLVDKISRRGHLASRERPKSMASLNDDELLEFRTGATSLNLDDNLSTERSGEYGELQQRNQRQLLQSRDCVDGATQQQARTINYADQRRNPVQNQTLNRYSSASSYQVMADRMPKIPFRYTTSCYGGEAVVYYPTCTHLAQQHLHHQQQQQQQQQQHQQAQSHHHRAGFLSHRVCARIHSLDRHSQSWIQQHQLPQRSHVMMLRDYYLSLQEQSQQKQHTLISHQQRRPPPMDFLQQRIQQLHKSQHPSDQQPVIVNRVQQIASQNDLTRPQQQHFQDGKYPMQAGSENLLYPQRQMQPRDALTTAPFSYQRVQPRSSAKSRVNQFNGLYVKRVSSPSHLVADAAAISAGNGIGAVGGRASLIVRPLGSSDGGGGGVSDAHCGRPASMKAVSQSSLSQQSSKVSSTSSTEHSADDESDDCSTGEWMESTMV